MNLKEFVKAELSGWKRVELVGLAVVFSIIFVNAFFVKDSVVAVISAVCGILYTTMAGKGKISCYFFGLMGTSCYCYLSLKNGLWGNLALYLCYYFPMQVLGIFAWRKHLDSSTKEIVKTGLRRRDTILLLVLTTIVCIGAILLIKFFNGSNPVTDGITTVLSVLGMYLTVKRCIEQWYVWMIVNGLSTIMWFNLVMHGAKAYSTLIMWFVYFVLAIYFFTVWHKELRDGTQNKI